MAKVTLMPPAGPDDPIYKEGKVWHIKQYGGDAPS